MIIYKVKTPLRWRTHLYKPCTVLKKNCIPNKNFSSDLVDSLNYNYGRPQVTLSSQVSFYKLPFNIT